MVEAALGSLFAGGWTIRDVTDLSLSQLELVIRCVARFEARRLETIFGSPSDTSSPSTATVPGRPQAGPPNMVDGDDLLAALEGFQRRTGR